VNAADWHSDCADISIIIQIQNTKEHIVGIIRLYGNQLYQYILRENASIPNE